MRPLEHCRLYTFVDTAYLHGRSAEFVASELCKGGSDLIQLRAKTSSLDEIRAMAESILPITRAAGVGLVINDHLSLADELGAELCHLGQEDFFGAGFSHTAELPTVKRRPAIGLSTHSPSQAGRAIDAAADYIAIGPVYVTGTKPTATPVTLEYVRWAAAHVKLPWFAIGGIKLQNLDEVLAAGAKRICIVSAILNSSDIAATCHKFRERLR